MLSMIRYWYKQLHFNLLKKYVDDRILEILDLCVYPTVNAMWQLQFANSSLSISWLDAEILIVNFT